MRQGPMTAKQWMEFHERMQRRVINLALVGAIVAVVLILIK